MSARKPVIDEHYDDKGNIVVYFERPCVKRGKCKHTIHYLQRNVIQILRVRWLGLSKAILWHRYMYGTDIDMAQMAQTHVFFTLCLWSLVLLCARVVWRRPPRSALLSTALLQAAVTSITNKQQQVKWIYCSSLNDDH